MEVYIMTPGKCLLIKQNLKNDPRDGGWVVHKVVFTYNLIPFCELEAHAKFQIPRTTPSFGEKYLDQKRRRQAGAELCQAQLKWG